MVFIFIFECLYFNLKCFLSLFICLFVCVPVFGLLTKLPDLLTGIFFILLFVCLFLRLSPQKEAHASNITAAHQQN